ncbi:MAG: Ig-like domain-containing protein [Reichenbachiella sp.]
MKRSLLIILISMTVSMSYAQYDWDGIAVPADAGDKFWELQEALSDDFNYEGAANDMGATFESKWKDGFINSWSGPGNTEWTPDNSQVTGGYLQIKATRKSDNYVYFQAVTSKKKLIYPVYVETRMKVMNSVMANAVWMLSENSAEEIDIVEAYGASYSESADESREWFAKRMHLSHHTFDRSVSPVLDYQPTDAGSWYADGSLWREDFRTVGVYWRDPFHLEYYIDGELVRTVSGADMIDPNEYLDGNGLSMEETLIISGAAQGWQVAGGVWPSDNELAVLEDNIFKVDWIRVYKPVEGENFVTDVIVSPESISTGIDQKRVLSLEVLPSTSSVKEVVWSSSDDAVITVDQDGWITGKAEGTATVFATSTNGQNMTNVVGSCSVTVQSDEVSVSVESIEITPASTVLALDGVQQLSAEILPLDATDIMLTWTSSTDAVASVDTDGLVTAHAEGDVIITATAAGGEKGESTVKVSVASILWNNSEATKNTIYTLGDDIDLSCTFNAGESTVGVDGMIFWLREVNESWVAVGNDIKVADLSVVGERTGTSAAKISTDGLKPTAELEEGNFYFLWIKYLDAEGVSYEVPGLRDINIVALPAEDIQLSVNEASVKVNATLELSAQVLPSNASQRVVWSTSAEAIATINADGLVTGISEGTATITATSVDGGFTSSATISVTPPGAVEVVIDPATLVLVEEEQYLLEAIIAPADALQMVNWNSSNPSIATVSEGLVTAVSQGTTTITATSVDGGISASTVVIVSEQILSMEVIPNKEITVFPNPAQEHINIIGDAYQSVTIYNTIGRKVLSKRLDSTQLDISSLSNGVYVLVLTGDRNYKTVKIQVNR